MTQARRILCFGLGFSARRLAAHLAGEGWRITATSRDPGKIPPEALRNRVTLIPFPLADPGTALAGIDALLVSAPPGEAGDPVLEAHADALRAYATGISWVGYLSTTGVYGDWGGGWVDEDSAPRPTQARSIRRLEAERAWLDLWREAGLPVHVFRLAGVYGPGRSALDQVRAGTARRIVKPGHRFGRIHVDDIAGVLGASLAAPAPGAIYNLSDDEPAGPAEVVAEACRLLGRALPAEVPFELARDEMSAMALSFWADNRRVDNARIKSALGYRLRYPTYREGLAAILAEDSQP